MLATTARSLPHDDLEISSLGAQPVLDEIGRVLGERREEGVLGFGNGGGLYNTS